MKTKKITAVILVALLFLSGCSNKYKKAYELGLKYLTEGNYEQAVLSFTQAININPKEYSAYHGRASAYLAAGKTEEAVSDLASAVENGMKAEEIPDLTAQQVVDEILLDFEDRDAEELVDLLKNAGFFTKDNIDDLQNALKDILERLIKDFADDGKDIAKLIKYLQDLGLINGGDVSELIRNNPASEIVQAVIDYLKAGKSIENLNGDYGKDEHVRKGMAFRIVNVKTVIEKIPDFSSKAEPMQIKNTDGQISGAWNIYTLKKTENLWIDVRDGQTGYDDTVMLKYKKLELLVSNFERIAYVTLFRNDSMAILIQTTDGVITSVNEVEENLKGIKAEYLEAVNSWNEVLGSLGLSVKDLYDHRILTQNLK